MIERIQKNVGVPWRGETVDTFKIGNPDTVVKGIATSFSATLDVCQRAHAAGKNLIIAHEPTFYNHNDETANLSGEIYEAKRNFIVLCAGYSTHKRFVLGGEECAAPFACKTLVSRKTLVAYLATGCSPINKGQIGPDS